MTENCELCGYPANNLYEMVDGTGGLAALCDNCPRLVQERLGSISNGYPTRSYEEALAAFQPRYWSVLKCFRESKDGRCTAYVAHYYYSSGETRALCSDCVNRPDLPCCMHDDTGVPISVQYDNEVYVLKR